MRAFALPLPRFFRALTGWWLHGPWAWRLWCLAACLATLCAGVAGGEWWTAHRQALAVQARWAVREGRRVRAIEAGRVAAPPDFVATLPPAPSVVEIMQTMQHAADAERAQVVSLQAEPHAATAAELGRLDLVVSIKAAYPAVVAVLRETLERYPGATLRQLSLSRRVDAPDPGVQAEARATLAFWSRPPGLAPADAAVDGLGGD